MCVYIYMTAYDPAFLPLPGDTGFLDASICWCWSSSHFLMHKHIRIALILSCVFQICFPDTFLFLPESKPSTIEKFCQTVNLFFFSNAVESICYHHQVFQVLPKRWLDSNQMVFLETELLPLVYQLSTNNFLSGRPFKVHYVNLCHHCFMIQLLLKCSLLDQATWIQKPLSICLVSYPFPLSCTTR